LTLTNTNNNDDNSSKGTIVGQQDAEPCSSLSAFIIVRLSYQQKGIAFAVFEKL
jgi:hypothetical protein